MITFNLIYEEYSNAKERYYVEEMEFEAEDIVHAINQLLDFYKDIENLRVVRIMTWEESSE